MKIPYIVLPLVLGGSVAAAAAAPEPNLSTAPPNPIVKMSVTPPDGQTQNLTAPESGMATLTLKDGTEIGVRPTIALFAALDIAAAATYLVATRPVRERLLRTPQTSNA